MCHLFILLGDNLLESAQTAMPESTGHNPKDDRKTRNAAARARSRVRKSSISKQDRNMSFLAKSMAAPIKLAKTADEKRADYYQV